MALALKVLNGPSGADNSQRRTILSGTGAVTGSYTAGGIAISWGTLNNVAGDAVLVNAITLTPLWVEFQVGIPGATPLMYILQYNYSTGKLQFYASGTATDGLDELGATTFPADLTAATLYWKAEFANEI